MGMHMRVSDRFLLVPALLAGLLLAACGQSDAPDDAGSLPTNLIEVKTAEEALKGAHIPTVDPATLNDAEIRKVIGDHPHCSFRYTSSGRPVLVASRKADGTPEAGVVKLNGNLVHLEASTDARATGGGFVLAKPPLRLAVQGVPESAAPLEGRQIEADLVFEVEQRLKVGYGGFLSCSSAAPHPAPVR